MRKRESPIGVSVRERVLAIESPPKDNGGGGSAPLRPLLPAQARWPPPPSSPTVASSSSATAKTVIGQQIAPWPTVDWSDSPPRAVFDPVSTAPPTTAPPPAPAPAAFMTHKRTLTPAPAADPPPVVQPLRPARKSHLHLAPLKTSLPPSAGLTTPTPGNDAAVAERTVRSSLTFGSQSSLRKKGSGSDEAAEQTPTPSPVFKKAQPPPGHTRQLASLIPVPVRTKKAPLVEVPITSEAKRIPGKSGSASAQRELDPPDELRAMLSSGRLDGECGDDPYGPESADSSPVSPSVDNPPVTSFKAPEPPVFRAFVVDEQNSPANIDEGEAPSSEDDTKKSFDFTGELKKLNKSGVSHRRSFVEQLENAFRSPAKYGIDGLLGVAVPPLPKGPAVIASANETIKKKKSTVMSRNYSLPIDTRKADPAILPGSATSEDCSTEASQGPSVELKTSSSMGSQRSDGELRKDFKFGGKPTPPLLTEQSPEQEQLSLTLSDIIPPPSLARALSNTSTDQDDSSMNLMPASLARALSKPSMVGNDRVLKSIHTKDSDVPPAVPRPRIDSDSNSKRRARDPAGTQNNGHTRNSSALSFVGFDSFAEVRRGFEFGQDRPAFYPPASATRRRRGKRESVLSIASVSSYGQVINPGSTDPFDFGDTMLSDIPQSEDDMSISMSLTVDDTFAFIRRQQGRQRVDSDASSFYFRAPAQSHMIQPYSRANRRPDSTFSVTSVAPPVSFNRNFGTRRRNDSNASASSMAVLGANGKRASWARHRQDTSIDSVMSDFSVRRLGRPGLGDKMLESAQDYCMPLTSISASPPASTSKFLRDRSPYAHDSILDEDEGRRSSINYDDRISFYDDSLFDKTGNSSSLSSGSVFGYDDFHPPQGSLLPPNQFRPVSMFSDISVHGPKREDDTMISVSVSAWLEIATL